MFEKTALRALTITPSLQSLFDSSVPTPRLIDVLCFTLVQDIATKQRLLEQLDVLKRGEYLVRELLSLVAKLEAQAPKLAAACAASAPTWPPPISVN